MSRKFVAYVDGGCPGNGRQTTHMFGSYLVYDVSKLPENATSHEALLLEIPFIENLRFTIHADQPHPVKVTNNSAEVLSLYQLLLELVNRNVLRPGNHVTIYSDSDLVVKQLIGVYRVKQPHLREVYRMINSLFAKYKDKHGETPWLSLKLDWISGDTMKSTRIGH